MTEEEEGHFTFELQQLARAIGASWKPEQQVTFFERVAQGLKGESSAGGMDRSQLLALIGHALPCNLVLMWEPDALETELHCVAQWHCPSLPASGLGDLLSLTRLWPTEGLAGRAWATARGEYASELNQDGYAGRSTLLAKAGLKTGAAIPVFLEARVGFVFECFSQQDCFDSSVELSWRSVAERIETYVRLGALRRPSRAQKAQAVREAVNAS